MKNILVDSIRIMQSVLAPELTRKYKSFGWSWICWVIIQVMQFVAANIWKKY